MIRIVSIIRKDEDPYYLHDGFYVDGNSHHWPWTSDPNKATVFNSLKEAKKMMNWETIDLEDARFLNETEFLLFVMGVYQVEDENV